MSDYQGWLLDSDGWKILGSDGYPYTPEEYRAELESEPSTPALNVPTIDVEPESVRDTEIHREIES